jgi:hypothetical protein
MLSPADLSCSHALDLNVLTGPLGSSSRDGIAHRPALAMLAADQADHFRTGRCGWCSARTTRSRTPGLAGQGLVGPGPGHD